MILPLSHYHHLVHCPRPRALSAWPRHPAQRPPRLAVRSEKKGRLSNYSSANRRCFSPEGLADHPLGLGLRCPEGGAGPGHGPDRVVVQDHIHDPLLVRLDVAHVDLLSEGPGLQRPDLLVIRILIQQLCARFHAFLISNKM